MEAKQSPEQPRRSFVVHVQQCDGPVVVLDLATLERVELTSLDGLAERLREWVVTSRANGHVDDEAVRRVLPQLTAAEARVAALAAQGVTNKGIAAALEVKLRTVESHLTSVYRKLAVQTRRELARRLNEASH